MKIPSPTRAKAPHSPLGRSLVIVASIAAVTYLIASGHGDALLVAFFVFLVFTCL